MPHETKTTNETAALLYIVSLGNPIPPPPVRRGELVFVCDDCGAVTLIPGLQALPDPLRCNRCHLEAVARIAVNHALHNAYSVAAMLRSYAERHP